MTSPRVTRPRFPKGYVDSPKRFLDWSEVEGRLSEAIHYWLCSVRPDGRPHVVPKWAAWVDGRLYFDGSPETRHARNIAVNPNVNVHLEDGARAVILDGRARAIVPDGGLGQSLSRAYRRKYESLGYSPAPDSWNAGGLYEITVQSVIAWTSFADDPTKFEFVELH